MIMLFRIRKPEPYRHLIKKQNVCALAFAAQICTCSEYQLIHTSVTFTFGQNGGIGSAIAISYHLADQMLFVANNFIK